jgi:hypothetical protein|tara:strand:- start:1949 stop:2149 length:201 start_codon:yes stop_codon:yes gene_type:complete
MVDKRDPYIITQVLDGIAGARILYLIITGNGVLIGYFATNSYGEDSPGDHSPQISHWLRFDFNSLN